MIIERPAVDETEVAAGAEAICREYGGVIGRNQARNIAYTVLVAARCAKFGIGIGRG